MATNPIHIKEMLLWLTWTVQSSNKKDMVMTLEQCGEVGLCMN